MTAATNRRGIVNCYSTVLEAHIHGNEQMNYSIWCSIFSWPQGYKREATDSSVHDKEFYRVQSSEDRSEDSSARKGSTEYRNQKIESLVYVL
jgi:hypothetical protein